MGGSAKIGREDGCQTVLNTSSSQTVEHKRAISSLGLHGGNDASGSCGNKRKSITSREFKCNWSWNKGSCNSRSSHIAQKTLDGNNGLGETSTCRCQGSGNSGCCLKVSRTCVSPLSLRKTMRRHICHLTTPVPETRPERQAPFINPAVEARSIPKATVVLLETLIGVDFAGFLTKAGAAFLISGIDTFTLGTTPVVAAPACEGSARARTAAKARMILEDHMLI